MGWFRKSPEKAREMGRIVAEESAKLGEYNLEGETLARIADERGISGYPWSAFVSAADEKLDALAETSGRTYCNDCGGWYLPHQH